MPQGTTSAAGPGRRARLPGMRFIPVFLLIVALFGAACEAPGRAPEGSRNPTGLPRGGVDPQVAFAHQDRDVWVLGSGTVERLLRDDTKAPRHQRFLVRIAPGQTLLIAHNIDVAPRVPLRKGDRKAGGWIVWKGQNFR